MANNGRGENEQKNNFSGSLKEENQPTVGWATQITNNATGVDNENVSGNLKDNHTNEQGVAVGKNAHLTAEEANISGRLKDKHKNYVGL